MTYADEDCGGGIELTPEMEEHGKGELISRLRSNVEDLNEQIRRLTVRNQQLTARVRQLEEQRGHDLWVIDGNEDHPKDEYV